MCPGRGDLTPSSSPHNVGKDPGSLSLERYPLQGLKSGEAGVFRLGVLSVYVLRACDLERTGGREAGRADRTVSPFAAPAWGGGEVCSQEPQPPSS